MECKSMFLFSCMFAAAGRWWDVWSILSRDEWTTLKEERLSPRILPGFWTKLLSSGNFHMLVRLRHKKDIICSDRFLFWRFQINIAKSSSEDAKRLLRYFSEQGWSVSSSPFESCPPWTLIFEGRGKETEFLHKSSTQNRRVSSFCLT